MCTAHTNLIQLTSARTDVEASFRSPGRRHARVSHFAKKPGVTDTQGTSSLSTVPLMCFEGPENDLSLELPGGCADNVFQRNHPIGRNLRIKTILHVPVVVHSGTQIFFRPKDDV